MRQILFSLLILLPVSLPAAEPQPAAPAPSPTIEVHPASPLVDMHFWVRKLASSTGEVPSMPGLAAAVETLRELDSQLGRPSLPLAPAWGAVDLLLFRASTAADFFKAAAALPETLTLPMGPPLPRAGIVRLAESYVLLEKPFLEQVWPWHQKMIERAGETVRVDLLPAAGEVFGDLHRFLGSPLPAQPVPLHLVAEAPRPGGVTFVAGPGNGLCLVGADAAVGSQWLEIVVHESIHALDLAGESSLDELRQRLGMLDPRLPAREAWNVSHALMFAQAAGTVRRVLAPHHRDYGEVSGVYTRLPKGAEVVAPAWQAWMRGEISRDAAIDRIVEGFRSREKEKGDPKAAPAPEPRGGKSARARPLQVRLEDLHHDLRDPAEVGICSQQDRSPLHGAGGNPDVVRRDRYACSTQGIENHSVAHRCFFVHGDHGNPGRGQKLRQLVQVLPEPASFEEASP